MKIFRSLPAFLVSVCLASTLLAQQADRSHRAPAADSGSLPAANAAAQAPALATIPRLIKFNGALRDLSGKPLSGPVDVTFSLYGDESGGNALWFETQTVQADSLGNYTVLLGAMTPAGVPMELFTTGEAGQSGGQAHWLGVQVANLPEQSRILLVSVPYAMKAGDSESLGGRPASAYLLSSQADAHAANAASLSSMITKGSTTTTSESPVTNTITSSYIPVYTDSIGTTANSILFQSGTKIGINTNAPAFNLDLNGAAFAIGPKAASPGAGGTMRFRDDTGTQRWLFGIPGSAGSQDFQMYDYSNGHAPIFVQNGAASYSLYLAGTGNVGIGTTTPAQKLDVAGNLRISGTGHGLVFPDGSTQTTAASGSGGGAASFSQLTGTVGSTQLSGTYTNSLSFSNASNSFTGSGAGLSNVNAATLNGLNSSAFVSTSTANDFTADQTITGNLTVTGTVNGTNIVPTKTTSCTIFGTLSTCTSANVTSGFTGGSGASFSGKQLQLPRFGGTTSSIVGRPTCTSTGANCMSTNVIGGTITGGGGVVDTTTYYDTVSNNWATVAGGAYNNAGDGTDPRTSLNCCQFVGGGNNNNASGNMTTVGGGLSNTASGAFSTVPGGSNDTASGQYSFAAGYCATSAHDGSFVWDGSTANNGGSPPTCTQPITSSAAGQFLALAPGGFTFYPAYSGGPTNPITIAATTGNVSMPGNLSVAGNLTVTGTINGGGGGGGGVTSFNGRTGAVTPAASDYSFSQISGTAGGTQLSGTYSSAVTFSNASSSFAGTAASATNALALNSLASSAFEQVSHKNSASGYAGLDATSRIAKAQAPSTTVFTDASNTFSTGTQDLSGATATLPVKTVLSANTPSTCVANKELLVKTDATSGQQLFICNSGGNGWNLVGDGGSAAGVLSFNGRTGAVVPSTNDYAFSQVSGTVGSTQLAGTYSSALTFSSASNFFTGDGSGLANVNAATLGGSSASAFQPAGSYATLGGNVFTNTQNINTGNLVINSGDLNMPGTTGSGKGVINFAGIPFAHSYGDASNSFLGSYAGNFSMSGTNNTATGAYSLGNNVTGSENTVNGYYALGQNSSGSYNTGMGWESLFYTTSDGNTAVGASALYYNSSGSYNTAVGRNALPANSTGSDNVAVGYKAGQSLTSGSLNIMIGYSAGASFTGSESNDIDIGNQGVLGESGTIRIGTSGGTHSSTYIAGIYGVTIASGSTVIIDSNGHLGTVSSSRRYKQDIRDMGEASDGLLRLRPVIFRYKKAYNGGSDAIQYGLIAEEVSKVYPELVVYNKNGQPDTVQYYKLDAMLLNEIQKLAKDRDSDKKQIGQLAIAHHADEAEISKLQTQVAQQDKTIQIQNEELARVLAQVRLIHAKLDALGSTSPNLQAARETVPPTSGAK